MEVNTEVRLSWTQENNSKALGYEIHRSDVSGFAPDNTSLIDTVGVVNEYTDEVPNGTYYYKIVVFNSYGSSSSGEFEMVAYCESTAEDGILAVSYVE